MPLVGAGCRIEHDDAVVAVAVGDIDLVRRFVDRGLRGHAELGRIAGARPWRIAIGVSVVGSFGRSGRSAGQFHWVHVMAVDKLGNVYTGEVDNAKRLQKLTLTSDALK